MREPRTVSGERPGRRWRAGLGCAGLGWAALLRGASSRGAEERRDPGRQGAPRPASRRGSPWPFAQTLRSSPPSGGWGRLFSPRRAACSQARLSRWLRAGRCGSPERSTPGTVALGKGHGRAVVGSCGCRGGERSFVWGIPPFHSPTWRVRSGLA